MLVHFSYEGEEDGRVRDMVVTETHLFLEELKYSYTMHICYGCERYLRSWLMQTLPT